MLTRVLTILALVAAGSLLFARAALPPPPSPVLGAFGRGPTVVLVHGLGSRAEHWLPVARDLARDHRVVLVELPGHGLIDMPGSLSLANAAASLDRALADEGETPVVLVGHSVGGLVAVAEALHSPRRVRALVLVETALRPQLGPADRAGLLGALERDYRGTLHACYSSFGRDSLQGERLYAGAASLDSTAMKAWLRVVLASDLSQPAARLTVPVLAVFASRSWPDSESWASAADSLGFASVPRVMPVRIEPAGHFVMLDQPRRLADAIRRFARGAGEPVFASR